MVFVSIAGQPVKRKNVKTIFMLFFILTYPLRSIILDRETLI